MKFLRIHWGNFVLWVLGNIVTTSFGLILYFVCFNFCCGCFNLFCNMGVCVCVGFVMCGCVCVCVGFVMCGCVYVCVL